MDVEEVTKLIRLGLVEAFKSVEMLAFYYVICEDCKRGQMRSHVVSCMF